MSLNWTPSAKFCASSAHMGWATAYGLAFKPDLYPYHLTLWIFLIYVLGKEYIADLTFLEHDTVGGSTLDAVTYLLGYFAVGWIANIQDCSHFYYYVAVIVAIILVTILAILDYHNVLPGRYRRTNY